MDRTMIGIERGEIHIWTVEFRPDDQKARRLESILSAAELKRAAAFRFEQDRIRFVQAHGFLRRILSRYTGVEPEKIVYESGVHGKPHLKDIRDIKFNLSHTKDMAAVAVAAGLDVGLDIEKQGDMNDMQDVARQFMTGDELRSMHLLADESQKRYFYRCWVRKEALLKAAGFGLGDYPRRISVMKPFGREQEKEITVSIESDNRTWRLETYDPVFDHVGAVCIESAPDINNYSVRIMTAGFPEG